MYPHTLYWTARESFLETTKSLSYEIEPATYRYKDKRVRSVYEITVCRIFREIVEMVHLHCLGNKKIMLITGLRIPEITDRLETLFFD